MSTTAELAFEGVQWFVDDLPGDPSDLIAPRAVAGAAWSPVTPTPTRAPRVIAVADEVAALLGLDPADLRSERWSRILTGNDLLPGMVPTAAAYGGHQFGNWAGQLGDGRAISLGEVVDVDGGHQQLQLKGAGLTPYSRGADGRAVLRSSIREFLCSEAMHHLGVPTTRALSLALTGDDVVRDMLYDGNPAPEPGAIVCRVAPSFVRFGSFELPASRGDEALLQSLVEHTVRRFYPHHVAPDGSIGSDQVVAWLGEVVDRTADLMVDWMRVGFVHGVMNTDNLSILGLTIDYGPYGWLEDFDPGWTPNTTDRAMKRYRYGNQPQIALWNLARLASALVPLVGDPEALREPLDRYGSRFSDGWGAALAAKIGLPHSPDTDGLADRLLAILPTAEIDMTWFFRGLGDLDVAPLHGDGIDEGELPDLPDEIRSAAYRPEEFDGPVGDELRLWLRDWARAASEQGDDERRAAMHAVNPRFVLRNYLAQEAIDAAEAGDHAMIDELLDVLRRPFDDQPGRERFTAKRPEWARTRVGCSMLSCSS